MAISRSMFDYSLMIPRDKVCESLKAELPEMISELSTTNEKKIFFENIHLGAIKNKITMRFEKKAL